MVDTTTFLTHTLGRPDSIRRILQHQELLSAIADRFDVRNVSNPMKAAQTLVRDAAIHISNSKARDLLVRCTGGSFVDTLQSLASSGLSLDKVSGEAYLVPFKGQCTLMIGYRGYVRLLANTGIVSSIQTACVYEGERFEPHGGTNPRIDHDIRVDIPRDDGHIVAVYAIFYHHDGTMVWEIMNRMQIVKVQKSSKAKDGPWKYWWGEMARNAVIRRAQKRLPKDPDNKAVRQLHKIFEEEDRTMGLAADYTAKLIEDQSIETVAEANKAINLPQPTGDTIPETEEKEGV